MSPASPSGAMLDTSVWIAVFEGEDIGLEEAQGDLDAVSSPIVLAELASVYARRDPTRPGPLEAVLATARVEELGVDDAAAGGALHGRLRRDGHDKVALGDCLIYATAQRVGAVLLTCDADLRKQPGVVVLRKRPTKSLRL